MTAEWINKTIKEHHEMMVEKGFYLCPECEGKKYVIGYVGVSDKKEKVECSDCNGTGKDQNKNIGGLLMLVVSELGEALEAHRCGRFAPESILLINGEIVDCLGLTPFDFADQIKDTFEDEIADVFLRLFDLCGYLGIDPSPAIPTEWAYGSKNIGSVLLQLSKNIIHISENGLTESSFSYAIFYTWAAAVNNWDIDIVKHIEAKIKYNKTRPIRHGKRY